MYHWRFLRFSFLGAQYWSGGHGLYNLESTLNEKMPTLLFHKLKHCNYWKDFFNCPMLLYFFVGSSENPRISHSFNSLWWYLHYCNILYCSSVFLKKITANGFHTIFLCWTLNPTWGHNIGFEQIRIGTLYNDDCITISYIWKKIFSRFSHLYYTFLYQPWILL